MKQEKMGGWWGWLGKPKASSPYHLGVDSGAVFLVVDIYMDVHNPQDRSRLPLVAIWHLTISD